MKRQFSSIMISVLLTLIPALIIGYASFANPGAQMYEAYNDDEDQDTDKSVQGNDWWCQTFKPSTKHEITHVVLRVWKQGDGGGKNMVVSIRATDGAGKPTGADLASDIEPVGNLPAFPGDWHTFTFSSPYLLNNGTTYAIVMRSVDSIPTDCPEWQADTSLATYANGKGGYTVNGGESWTMYTGLDMMFEEWGIGAPSAPTNVSATDGVHTDKVVVTWTKSEDATGYQVYRDGTPLGWLGDVATFDDTGADAPTITPGAASASDGTHADYVALSLSGQSANNGTIHTYKVKAKNAAGESGYSGTNTGYRGVGSLTYQWQRSAADSDANYSNIEGATTVSYNDTGAPADGSGRYYRCVENATGASQQISSVDRGYRTKVPTVTTQTCTSIAVTSATGNGNITDTGGQNATRRGFCYKLGTTGDPTTSDNTTYDDGSFGTGAYTKSIPGLSAGTNYRVRAYAINPAGTGYGTTVQLTTYNYPTITTNSATYVTYSTARLNASVVNDGGTACEIRFQYYTGGGDWTDNETAWVPGYTTGQHPYKDISNLDDETEYHFRVQARIGTDIATGSGVDFTTESLLEEPSNFKAFSNSDSVVLSWTKDAGASETLIRYTQTHYPTSITDGTQVYLGTSGTTSHTGLTPGHSYYYSAWGKSDSTYSDNYTTVMATTLAIVTGGEAPEAPTTPATWFQTPDYTKFSPLPIYDPMNKAADAMQIPRGSFWLFSALFLCAASGIITFLISKHAIPPLIVLAVALALCSLAGLLPLWMMAFTLIFGLGAWQLGRER